MRDFRDAKAMAQTLRDALKTKSVNLSHSECLELVAKSFGLPDWNVMAARIQAAQPTSAAPRPAQADTVLPDSVPVVPIRDVVFFPRMVTPLFIARPKSRHAVERALSTDGILFVVTQRRSGDDNPDFNALYPVGVTVSIVNRTVMPDETLRVYVSCLERKVVGRGADGEFLAAEALPFEESRGDTVEAFELARAVLDGYRAYAKLPPGIEGLFRLPGVENPTTLADTVAPSLSVDIDKKQQILETGDVVKRLQTILDVMSAGTPSQ